MKGLIPSRIHKDGEHQDLFKATGTTLGDNLVILVLDMYAVNSQHVHKEKGTRILVAHYL